MIRGGERSVDGQRAGTEICRANKGREKKKKKLLVRKRKGETVRRTSRGETEGAQAALRSVQHSWNVPIFFFRHVGDCDSHFYLCWTYGNSSSLSPFRSLHTGLALHCHGNDVTVSHLQISLLLNTTKMEHGSVREKDREKYTEERGGERETEEEKGLCFPGNRLGVSPTPIGSQLVGISLLPTIVGANTFSVSRFSLSLLFLLCLFIRMHAQTRTGS